MNDDLGVRQLVEFIFDKEYVITSEMTAQDLYFPQCLQTNDFDQKLSHVLSVRGAIVYLKWVANYKMGNVFPDHDILSDHKSYLASIIFNCLKEQKCQTNVFESFISVCSGVDFFSDETLRRTGLNYRDLNTDIAMEIYVGVLKRTLIRRKGFKRLVEYISKHRYLTWDFELVKRAVYEDTSDPLVDDMQARILKEIEDEQKTLHSFKFNLDALQTSAAVMAQKVLTTTTVQLPTFSMDQNSNQMMNTSRSTGAAKTVEGKGDCNYEPVEISQGCSSPYAKTSLEAKQPENIAWYESVVQEVIKYNQSKIADLESSNNFIQKRAGEVLEHLKDTIKSLIDLLDEYDEE